MSRILIALAAACALPAGALAAPPNPGGGPVAVIGAPHGERDLRAKILAPARPVAGRRLLLRVIVTNPSSAPMTGVRVRLRLPAGLSPLRAPGARRRGRLLEWRIRSIAPGRSRIRRVVARLSPRARARRCAVVRAAGPTVAVSRRCMWPRRSPAEARE